MKPSVIKIISQQLRRQRRNLDLSYINKCEWEEWEEEEEEA
jgi:hypothetical protein